MLKKIIKKIIIFIVIMIILWAIILAINVVRCLNYKNPILCFYSIEDEVSKTYKFIGYTIYNDKYGEKIIKTSLSFFNIKLIETDSLSLNRNPENTKIEIIESTITKTGVTIVVTDNNKFSYGWSCDYKIEQKIDNNWKEMKFEEALMVDIDNIRDENNQITIEIDWTKQYDQLSTGTYRIVKEVYDDVYGYVNIYSNEFNIYK